jgi:hypothetical protein
MCIHGSHDDEKNDEVVGQDHRHQADEAVSAIAATAARGSETRQKAAKLQSFLLVVAEQIGALRERAAAGTAAATAGTTTHSYPALPPQQNMALAKDGRAVQALDDLARLLSPDNLRPHPLHPTGSLQSSVVRGSLCSTPRASQCKGGCANETADSVKATRRRAKQRDRKPRLLRDLSNTVDPPPPSQGGGANGKRGSARQQRRPHQCHALQDSSGTIVDTEAAELDKAAPQATEFADVPREVSEKLETSDYGSMWVQEVSMEC